MPYVGRTPSAVPVTVDDIPANSIDASKIVDGSIELAEIADNSITDAKLNSSKLDGIETGATNYIHPTTHATADIADNAITDAKLNSAKLNGIEAGATADQTKADIEALGIAASSITGALPAIDGSALTGNVGKVLQVVHNTISGHPFASTTSHALVSSGFSVSITPKQIGSKIRIQFSTNLWIDGNGGGGLAIYLGSTNLYGGSQAGIFVYSNGSTDNYGTAYLETMYTTTSLSPLTFTLWFQSWAGGSVHLNQHQGVPAAVATEIAQ